jgi:threonine/homoserine/homoserine lactone efflux protein
VFTALKILGSLYLVALGVKAIVHRHRPMFDAPRPASSRRLWREGFVVGLTNPKTSLFFLAVLPQFADPARGHLPVQLLILGVVFCILATVTDSCYGLAAGTLRRWLDRRPGRAGAIAVTSGVVMIGLGARVAFTGRHD